MVGLWTCTGTGGRETVGRVRSGNAVTAVAVGGVVVVVGVSGDVAGRAGGEVAVLAAPIGCGHLVLPTGPAPRSGWSVGAPTGTLWFRRLGGGEVLDDEDDEVDRVRSRCLNRRISWLVSGAVLTGAALKVTAVLADVSEDGRGVAVGEGVNVVVRVVSPSGVVPSSRALVAIPEVTARGDEEGEGRSGRVLLMMPPAVPPLVPLVPLIVELLVSPLRAAQKAPMPFVVVSLGISASAGLLSWVLLSVLSLVMPLVVPLMMPSVLMPPSLPSLRAAAVSPHGAAL